MESNKIEICNNPILMMHLSSPIYRIFVIVAVLFCVTGCNSDKKYSASLKLADNLIMERPDSALAILKDIDISDLTSPQDKALYGLLYIMALDKNHLDPTEENLIKDAREYFIKSGDKQRELLATYYLGRVKYLSQEYQDALIYFYKAKELAEKDSIYFWNGMACRGISDTYLEVSSSADELHYAMKEVENFKKSGVQPYLNYSLLDLCRAYNNNGMIDEVISLAGEVMDSALLYKDRNLYYEILRMKAKNLQRKGNYNESEPLFRNTLESGYATREDSLLFVLNLISLGKIREGENLINQVSKKPSARYYQIRYLIFKRLGDSSKALEEHEQMNGLLDEKLARQRSISLSSNLADYFEVEKKLTKMQLKVKEISFWLILVSSFLISLILIIAIIYIRARYRRALEGKIMIIEEIKRSLINKETEKEKSIELNKKLLSSQHAYVSQIGDVLRFNPDINLARKKISGGIEQIIKDFSLHGKMLHELETQVNEVYDNLFSDFRKDLPDMKDSDYALYLYSIMGFSNAAISILLGENKIEAVYNRKRRLKDKIKGLEEQKNIRYRAFL